MAKEPQIGASYDDEERELYEAIEADDYVPQSVMNDEMLEEHREAARRTINDECTKITLRLSKNLVQRLKAEAMREGMPYQTLIGSILHKSVS